MLSTKPSRKYRHHLRSESKQDTQTPDWLYRWLDRQFPFQLDAAASRRNARYFRFYTRHDNGLLQPWYHWTFCNPPFRRIRLWIDKALWEASLGNGSVLVLPQALSSEWYRAAYRFCHTWLLNPRFPYKGRPDGVPFGTKVLIFDQETTAIASENRIRLVDVRPFISP